MSCRAIECTEPIFWPARLGSDEFHVIEHFSIIGVLFRSCVQPGSLRGYLVKLSQVCLQFDLAGVSLELHSQYHNKV